MDYSPVPLDNAIQELGLSRRDLRDVPRVVSIPGTYGTVDGTYAARTVLLDRKAVAKLMACPEKLLSESLVAKNYRNESILDSRARLMAVISAPALRVTTPSGAVECDWGVFCHGCQGTYPGQHKYTWESFLLHVARRGLQHGIRLPDLALRHAIDMPYGRQSETLFYEMTAKLRGVRNKVRGYRPLLLISRLTSMTESVRPARHPTSASISCVRQCHSTVGDITANEDCYILYADGCSGKHHAHVGVRHIAEREADVDACVSWGVVHLHHTLTSARSTGIGSKRRNVSQARLEGK